MRQASSKRCALASGPAISRARAAISSASAGSRSAGRFRPWRRALRDEIALPALVLGPVLARALALDLAQNRVAARLRGHGHAIDALDLVNLEPQGAGHHRIHR